MSTLSRSIPASCRPRVYAGGVRRAPLATTLTAALLASGVARSQEPDDSAASPAPTPAAEPEAAPTPTALDALARTQADLDKTPPPPSNIVYLQYGVALAAEMVASAGALCDNRLVPCVLGPGAGIAIRAGWRGTGALYLGGAYEVTKQDPNKLYRLALLQQARAEARWYFATARQAEPYASFGGGVAGYGNEWGIDTWGPAGSLGAGVEVQISRRTVVGLGLAYRLLYLSAFTDTSGAARDGGVAQLVGLDIVLEQRDPIFTSANDPPER